MRSHEAVTIPVTSTRWRPGTRHHMRGPGVGGSRRPETARPAVCLKAVRTFTRLGRYGISPSPSVTWHRST